MAEDKRESVKIGINLSDGLIKASLALIGIEFAFATVFIEKRSPSFLFYVFLIMSILSFIRSIYEGGKGIDGSRKLGYRGYWLLSIGKSRFNNQALYCYIGLLFFGLLIPLVVMQRGAAPLTVHPQNIGREGEILFPLALLGLVLIILGILAFKKNKILSGILVTLGSIAFSFGITMEIKGLRISIERKHRNPQIVFVRGVTDRFIVGPFEPGESEPQGQKSIHTVASGISKILSKLEDPNKEIDFIVIIGHADKRNLKPHLAEIYETNLNLSYARAKYVHKCMKDVNTRFDDSKCFVMAAGSDLIHNIRSVSEMNFDRRVDVYIKWADTANFKN